jgi:hypothetical protein
MAGDENETKQIVSDVIVLRDIKIRHGHVSLRLKLATQFFMFSLEELVAAKVIDGAVLRRGHQPSAGIVWNARLRPPLESNHESILRKFLGHTDVADDASEPGYKPGRLDPPNCVDCAVGSGGRHGYPSHHLQIVRATRRPGVLKLPVLFRCCE